MSKQFRNLCFFLPALFLVLVQIGAGQPVQIKQSHDRLSVLIEGKPFSDYIFQGYSRPILYPLIGPGGIVLTRHWPLKEGIAGEEKDHPHHKSFWWAHGAMNGVDFWSESKDAGKTVHQEFTKVQSGETGIIKAKNKYVGPDGKVVCTDERTLTFYSQENPRFFDFEITLHASNGDLVFGDTKEGTMSVRVAESMKLKGKKGTIVNSEGVRGGETWGKRAKWVDYHGPVEGKKMGIAIFDHPSNPRHPTWWHVRDYGLFGANPFGIHDFEKKEKGAGDLKVKAGESITFKYRFFLHEGNEKEGGVEEAYRRYATTN